MTKSYLRSTMNDDRLSALSILSIKREYGQKLDFEDTIADFVLAKARKVRFWGGYWSFICLMYLFTKFDWRHKKKVFTAIWYYTRSKLVLTATFLSKRRGDHYMLFLIYRMFVIRKIAKNGITCSENNECPVVIFRKLSQKISLQSDVRYS